MTNERSGQQQAGEGELPCGIGEWSGHGADLDGTNKAASAFMLYLPDSPLSYSF